MKNATKSILTITMMAMASAPATASAASLFEEGEQEPLSLGMLSTLAENKFEEDMGALLGGWVGGSLGLGVNLAAAGIPQGEQGLLLMCGSVAAGGLIGWVMPWEGTQGLNMLPLVDERGRMSMSMSGRF